MSDDSAEYDTGLYPEEMTPQERHDRLQEAWSAVCQIDAHMNQEGYEIDFDEKRLEATRAIGDVIGYYQKYEDAELDNDE